MSSLLWRPNTFLSHRWAQALPCSAMPHRSAVEAMVMNCADLAQFGTITRDWFSAYPALMAPLCAPFGSLVGKSPPANAAPATILVSMRPLILAMRGDAA